MNGRTGFCEGQPATVAEDLTVRAGSSPFAFPLIVFANWEKTSRKRGNLLFGDFFTELVAAFATSGCSWLFDLDGLCCNSLF